MQEDTGDVEKHREFLYKVLVIGDIGVGKTSIIKRYVHGIFSAHYKSTVRDGKTGGALRCTSFERHACKCALRRL